MPVLVNGGERTMVRVGVAIGDWVLSRFEYNHPGAQFGTHLFEFRRGAEIILVSNVYWSGDKMPVMWSGKWWPACPKELRKFGDRHSAIIYEIVPVAPTGQQPEERPPE